MNYDILILDKLLDKYEKRVAASNRKVRIVLGKNEVKIPSIESNEYQDFKDVVLHLNSKRFIGLDWVRKNYIINSVWLNLENVEAVYHYLKRQSKEMVIRTIEASLQRITNKWIRNYLENECNSILTGGKITGVWSKEHNLIHNFLMALEGIDKLNGNSVSMRAFSVKTYGDSKKFEKEIKKLIIPVIKQYEPGLTDVEEISDRKALAQIGIIMMSETFEFCGNVKIHFLNGVVDFSPIKKGACISSESISDICSIEIFNTDRIVFIENKTNYLEYCLNNKSEHELVVYHGGFYSPQRGEFFYKLCSETDLPVYFWGDIDYGGFKMFVRLKNNIIKTLRPLNMNLHSYNHYKSNGLKKNKDYIAKLGLLKSNPDYYEFFEVIDAIITEKTTVEQECFLEKNCY